MNHNAYNLMRQLGLMPGAEAQKAQDPVLAELVAGIEPLLKAALAKGQKAQPMPLRAAAFLRSLQSVAQEAATYTAPLPARKKEFSPVTTVFRRNDIGRITKGETTFADGSVMTTIPKRDEVGRIISAEHSHRGRKFITKIKRDLTGRIASTTISMDGTGQPTGYDVCDSNDSTIQLLAAAVENAFPADPAEAASYAPGRNPLPRAYVQRDASGRIYMVNVGNQQLRPDQVHSRPTSVTVEIDSEGRPFVRIRGWKMVITHDFSGQVQALDPLPAE